MTAMIVGLAIFLGVHSTRIFADDWRSAQVARRGEVTWKIGYSVLSVIGFVVLVWGYGEARSTQVNLWSPPLWTRHAAALLTLPAFVLLAAAYVPGTRIKAAIGHPMVAGVKLWAIAHLLSNGRIADLILFGAILVWAVASFTSSRRRDRIAGKTYAAGPVTRDLIAVGIGLAAWAAFAFDLHARLIGVAPFG